MTITCFSIPVSRVATKEHAGLKKNETEIRQVEPSPVFAQFFPSLPQFHVAQPTGSLKQAIVTIQIGTDTDFHFNSLI